MTFLKVRWFLIKSHVSTQQLNVFSVTYRLYITRQSPVHMFPDVLKLSVLSPVVSVNSQQMKTNSKRSNSVSVASNIASIVNTEDKWATSLLRAAPSSEFRSRV